MYELIYSARAMRDGDDIRVDIPDFDDMNCWGTATDSDERLIEHAHSAIVTNLQARIDCRDPIPRPTRIANADFDIIIEPLMVLKIRLYEEMLAAGIRRADLAKRLGKDEAIVRRMLDLNHASKVDQIEQALETLGKRLVVSARTVDLDQAA